MITLTTPPTIATQLGATSSSSYAKMRIMDITADPVAQSISAAIQLIDTANTNLPMLIGSLSIMTQGNPPSVEIAVPDFAEMFNVVPLTSAEPVSYTHLIEKAVRRSAIPRGFD